jgi:hypothetical protein
MQGFNRLVEVRGRTASLTNLPAATVLPRPLVSVPNVSNAARMSRSAWYCRGTVIRPWPPPLEPRSCTALCILGKWSSDTSPLPGASSLNTRA